MHKLENLTVGWLSTNIRAVAEAGLLSRFNSILITSIDSIVDLSTATMRNEIAAFDPEHVLLGPGIVVRGDSIVRFAASTNVFTGFDELWCFERLPTTPLPDDLSIVAPLNIDTDTIPARLLSWMTETHCKLGLGDGIGLNYATPDEAIAKRLEELAKEDD